jgi:CheY-like chemotaxis protein
MSDDARTVLVVTDDPSFSAMVSEQILRAGVQTIRFAPTQEAPKLTRHFMPDLVLVHMPRGCLAVGWECYHMIQSDATLTAIPILFYTSPGLLAERVVGAPTERHIGARLAVPDRLIGQISPLLGVASVKWQSTNRESNDYRFPIGRDDL